VPAERGKQIAAAIEKLGKPIYIHCHHGKHRSASATATACVIAGLMTPEAALARMQVSGTAAEYEGLFASARNARPLPLSELPAHPENFPASSKVSGTASTMTAVDNAFDELKIVRGEQWQVPKSHPDLLPAASAGQVHDLLSGLASDAECQQRPAGFHQLLQTSIAAAAALQQAIDKQDLEQCEARYSALNQSCKQCHKQFRDRR
jgi:cytochrome c556